MANNNYISDELLAAYLEGNVDMEEMAQVLEAIGTDDELHETLDIALQVDEAEEISMLKIAAEGGRNLCDVQCEAYVMRQHGLNVSAEELLEVAKENHWIRRAGTPLQYMGNLLEHKGLKVARKYDATKEDLKEALKRGESMIVAVDSDKLYPERPDEEDVTNHAVVVTGINEELITIYDPENNNEIDVKLPLFINAWKESQNYLVLAMDK